MSNLQDRPTGTSLNRACILYSLGLRNIRRSRPIAFDVRESNCGLSSFGVDFSCAIRYAEIFARRQILKRDFVSFPLGEEEKPRPVAWPEFRIGVGAVWGKLTFSGKNVSDEQEKIVN